MKKESTTFTRYFVFLIIVFVAWLFLLNKISKTSNFITFFGGSDSSLSIMQSIDKN